MVQEVLQKAWETRLSDCDLAKRNPSSEGVETGIYASLTISRYRGVLDAVFLPTLSIEKLKP